MNTATAEQMHAPSPGEWVDICHVNDLVPNSGISALIDDRQAAIFYVPDASPAVYALDNWCPAAGANLLSRGMVGDIKGQLVVASPLYKEHYVLSSGACLEKPLSVRVWPVCVQGERVLLQTP